MGLELVGSLEMGVVEVEMLGNLEEDRGVQEFKRRFDIVILDIVDLIACTTLYFGVQSHCKRLPLS